MSIERETEREREIHIHRMYSERMFIICIKTDRTSCNIITHVHSLM